MQGAGRSVVANLSMRACTVIVEGCDNCTVSAGYVFGVLSHKGSMISYMHVRFLLHKEVYAYNSFVQQNPNMQ